MGLVKLLVIVGLLLLLVWVVLWAIRFAKRLLTGPAGVLAKASSALA
ncbi:MAG TPA: hypothetical protein VM889_13375 [Candidatus Thermoplasmatota archaeon]|nr:hypothetical protein [Candidatus Thermoplasmatota archaeon]